MHNPRLARAPSAPKHTAVSQGLPHLDNNPVHPRQPTAVSSQARAAPGQTRVHAEPVHRDSQTGAAAGHRLSAPKPVHRRERCGVAPGQTAPLGTSARSPSQAVRACCSAGATRSAAPALGTACKNTASGARCCSSRCCQSSPACKGGHSAVLDAPKPAPLAASSSRFTKLLRPFRAQPTCRTGLS